MKNLQRVGRIAALLGAATILLGAMVYATLLVPKGFGSDSPDPIRIVALLVGNQAVYRVWL